MYRESKAEVGGGFVGARMVNIPERRKCFQDTPSPGQLVVLDGLCVWGVCHVCHMCMCIVYVRVRTCVACTCVLHVRV